MTMPQTNHDHGADDQMSFEESLAALDDAVRRLEDGELDLAAALGAYESGIRHLKCCYARLEEAERRIDVLCGIDSRGMATVKPLTADDPMSLEEKQQSRSRRRTHAPQPPRPQPPRPQPPRPQPPRSVPPHSTPPDSRPPDSGPPPPGSAATDDNVDGDGRLF